VFLGEKAQDHPAGMELPFFAQNREKLGSLKNVDF